MSWVDNIKKGLVIKTGDGLEFTPDYIISAITKEYNITEFNFPNIKGTLVDRREPLGRKITIDIFFQGDDHLDIADSFDKSADDKRPWTISHPLHGSLLVQPASTKRDPTGLGLTKFTLVLMETLSQNAPITTVDPREQMLIDITNLNIISGESFEANVIPGASDIVLLDNNLDDLFDDADTFALTDLEFQEYFNLYNTAITAIINATAEPLFAINAMRAFTMQPSLFKIAVKDRLNIFKEQLSGLISGLVNIVTPNEKNIFENNAGGVIMAMVQSAAFPIEDDFNNTIDVLDVIDTLVDSFDNYLDSLDTIQTDTGDELDSYIPDHASLSGMTIVINFAVANLFEIALDAKQERQIILEADSNLINLAHRFVILDEADVNLETFKKNNGIGLSEILLIKKGRSIRYYV